jgi:glycosyltransferase involved in cell wall biosynthesis
VRILVAHLVSAARSGGMSRLMGRAHDLLEANGHEVQYLTADDVKPAMRGRLGRLAFQFLVWRTAKAAANRGRPFDIINVHEPHGAMVASFRAGLGNASVVVMTHGVERRGWEVALAHGPSRPPLRTRLVYPLTSLPFSRVALRRADRVICLNLQDREFLDRRFGIDPARVTPVTPGADPIFGAAAVTREYDRVERLLFAGTWLPRKGVSELVEAFNTLVREGRNIHLDILGAGVSEGDILSAFSAEAAPRVRVLGGGDDAMMSRAMVEADVFMLPSLFEGTPLTLIEAMWSGLPVITTRTAGMQDVVSHERSGLLVAPGDGAALAGAIRRLIDEPGLRRAIGTEAHSVATTQYTWRNAAATFELVYRDARSRHDATSH